MAFQEFYCVPAGTNGASNMNAGDKTTLPTTTTNGAYTQGAGAGGTDQFVAASGTPFAGAAVNDYVSVYADGVTTPRFIGAITAVNSSTSIDISLTRISGTRPTTAASGWTATLGGVWLGPTGAVGHPFGFITAASTDGSGNTPRVNGVGTSNVTAAMTHNIAGPCRFEGMTGTPGDEGRWVIDGGTSGTAYTPLTVSVNNIDLVGLVLAHNGASSGGALLNLSGSEAYVRRCVFHDSRGAGATVAGGTSLLIECEAYACNANNSASLGGFVVAGAATTLMRCVSHDHLGSNAHGFVLSVDATLNGCIADTCGGAGYLCSSTTDVKLFSCDAYNNTSDGVTLSNSTAALFYLESCNLVKNGGYGVNGSGAGARNGAVVNCGFGSGTQVNTSGSTTGLKSMVESSSITYTPGATPWVDPANGDFRVNLAAAKGTGRGSFTQTAASYTGTIGYPDVGAAQHQDTSVPVGQQCM